MSNSYTLESNVQFSVFLDRKPGELGRIVHDLADNKVNLLAMSMMDASDHGVLRLVAEKTDAVRTMLGARNVSHSETTVLTSLLPNKPGAMADVVERLDQERIQVHYAYCTSGSRNGKALGVFKVSNPSRAMQVLSERKPRRTISETARRGRSR